MAFQPEPTLVESIRYNQWANQQLLAICMGLDDRLVTAVIQDTAGSIVETFRHILRAEADFLKRIHGTNPEPAFSWDEEPGLKQLASYAKALGEAFLETIKHVSPTQKIHEEDDVWTFDYQARLLFMSLIYHGISHRTDITTYLNQQGVELPELDVWGYQAAFPTRFEAEMKKK